MKQFFKIFFASLLSFFVGICLLFLLLSGIVATMISTSGKQADSLDDNSILELDLSHIIPERSSPQFSHVTDLFDDLDASKPGLKEILKSIDAAAHDDHIKGIYLPLSFSPNAYALLEEIRDALIRFKKSGKFILAYGEMTEEHAYYVGSIADKVYLNPAGEMLFNGFSYSTVYLKDMLDKMGLEANLIRHGKFKAAGEPFISNHMSEENRDQIKQFIGSLYQHFRYQIAVSRKLNEDSLEQILAGMKVRSVADAREFGLIDGLKYEDEIRDELRVLSGLKTDDDLNLVSVEELNAVTHSGAYKHKHKIAVIYAQGDIISGHGDYETIGSETICKALVKARKDSAVKAIVLRVNSPGGSALASDVIYREVLLTQKVKPVVVSMGAMAASGGYYIAAPAERIFVEPNTITGSIGVFGLTLNAEKLLRDKLGIRIEKVNFGEYADMGSIDRPMTAQEMAIMQQMIDRIYMDFINKVALGRKLTVEAVDSLAQGRVWSGKDAIDLKLADELGGIENAIAFAAQKAGLGESYRILNLPEQKDPIQQLIGNISKSTRLRFTQLWLGDAFIPVAHAREALKYQGIQARIPWMADIQ